MRLTTILTPAILLITMLFSNVYAGNRCMDNLQQHTAGMMLSLAYCDLHPEDLNTIEGYLKAHPTITALNLENNPRLFSYSNTEVLSQDGRLKYVSLKNTMEYVYGDMVMHSIAKMPNVRVLDLSDNHLSDYSIQDLMQTRSLLALILDDNPGISFNGLTLLAKHPSITHLSLKHLHLNDESLKALSNDRNLISISLNDDFKKRNDYNDDSLMGFANNPNLVEFSLAHAKINAPFVQALVKSKSLRVLGLSDDQLDDASIIAITGNPFITSLNVSHNPSVRLYNQNIAAMPSLAYLNVSSTQTVNLDALAKNNHLVALNVDNTNLEGSWASFKKNTTLKAISMKNVICSNIWINEYRYIAQLKALTSLNLASNSGLTDEGLIALTKSPSITTLNLEYDSFDFSPDLIKALATDSHLQSLGLGSVGMSVEVLGQLLKNPALKQLDYSGFHNAYYEEDGLALSTAEYLRTVNISYTFWFPAVIQAIAANTHLVTIIRQEE